MFTHSKWHVALCLAPGSVTVILGTRVGRRSSVNGKRRTRSTTLSGQIDVVEPMEGPGGSLELPVIRLDPGLPLPGYATAGDAGADLVARTAVTLAPRGGRAVAGKPDAPDTARVERRSRPAIWINRIITWSGRR